MNQSKQILRADREIISRIIPQGAHVLDLGCGDGSLLADLVYGRGARGMGIEIDERHLVRSLGKGLSVCQYDLDRGLPDFPDRSYDYVILNQTLQVIRNPLRIIREMLRVGKFGIVGFPNFGHWRLRAELLFRGRMPKSKALPFEWYETPNIHQLTIVDFRAFCNEEDITIIREEYFMLGKWRQSPLVNPIVNLLAINGMFVLEGSGI